MFMWEICDNLVTWIWIAVNRNFHGIQSHCGLHSDAIGLGRYWLKQWLIAQSISWTSVDSLPVRSSGIHLRAISQQIPQSPIAKINFNIIIQISLKSPMGQWVNSSPTSAAYMRQWNTRLFINENTSDHIFCEMAAILSRGDELRWKIMPRLSMKQPLLQMPWHHPNNLPRLKTTCFQSCTSSGHLRPRGRLVDT